ncbi:MAG: DNA primase, partial [Candidatus Cloacimonetes bacterium]|nr:DNA primase [Candidatus Cloacimonadota bacterium]
MDRAIIDNVLERTNIIEVIGSYFPLSKSGANYKALCPFHEEKTPSFLVSERKQIYKCFGCGKSGNAISFVMDYEKVSFWEALKKLAARVGITLEENRTDKKKQTRQELIYNIYALARDHYRQNLQEHGQFARNYLRQRSISEETSSHFELGFALDSFGALKNYLLKNSINEKIMLKSGLFSQGERGLYDVFRNRLMFPIHSVTGQVVAFGGRNLQDDQKGGKYINSPTTDIYTKGNELYGLHITRFNIQK